jgi:hypothetical protein
MQVILETHCVRILDSHWKLFITVWKLYERDYKIEVNPSLKGI